jgi:hypothetical protein
MRDSFVHNANDPVSGVAKRQNIARFERQALRRQCKLCAISLQCERFGQLPRPGLRLSMIERNGRLDIDDVRIASAWR